ncbi:NUDIX hydrolase [Kineococcus gynurae]|uniref:NUDIX hydrolase n=1 Tax=Kineococcus gynurae TaxID=452979 RepID=A0ABV5LUC9_9ACTN
MNPSPGGDPSTGGGTLPDWLQPLASALPGVRSADLDWREDRAGPQVGARPAAVLVLLADGPAGPEVLLTERAGSLRQHSGQVAFPGGRADPGDASPAATALREAAEEVGLDATGVDVLGQLPGLQLRHSRHEVTAVVAHWRAPGPVGVVDRGEVARVESVPLAELYAPQNRCRVRAPGGYEGPAFATRGLLVWGFTAEVLVRVLRLGGLEPTPTAAASGVVGDGGPRVLGIEDALNWARS